MLAGYALRSPALSQAREAALVATAVMIVEGTDGVAHAAHGPARAGLCGRLGTRSHLLRLSRGSEGDTPLVLALIASLNIVPSACTLLLRVPPISHSPTIKLPNRA